MLQFRKSGGQLRSAFTALASALTVFTAACSQDGSVAPAKPELPAQPAIPAQYRGAAYIADVSSLKKTVRISAPAASIKNPIAARIGGETLSRPTLGGDGDAFGSLLGGDVIDLVASNYQAGALGAAVPGKILITFDLQVVNKLNSVNLIVPTFPTPPAGTTGVVMFPFEIGVTTTSGGVSVGGAGNEVIVTTPRGGAVTVSDDWDGNGTAGSGAPHNFFNDVGCTATANDCFRWEEYGVIPALGTSSARKVGFLIDPTVGDFRVKIILAADLQNATGAAQFGTIAGTVTSPQSGAITGATISVSGGFSGTTGAGGAYSITNIGVGSRTVSVSNLPANCTVPASQSVTVTNGATSTANFSVTCSVLTGTVAGTISSSLGGGLSGVTVSVTPNGGSAQTFTTGGTGGYTVTVPVSNGTGVLTLTNLPANCTNPGPQNYSGLTSNGSVTLNVTVTCTPPPQFGTLTGTITSSQGGGIPGATITITPTTGTAPAPVTTNASGVYSSATVPVGGGTFTITGLPSNCTAPAAQTYAGITNGGTVTVNVTVTCAFAYAFAGTWSAIANTGPTGRQVTLSLAVNMGPTDELVGTQFSLTYNGALLTYASRQFPNASLDFGAVASPSAGLVNVSLTSSQSLTAGGNVNFVNLTFNIPTGATGTVATPSVAFVEFLVGTPASNIDKKSSVVVTIPTLVIP